MQLRFAHRRYRLKFKAPVRTAHGVWAEREGLLVRVESETGRVGYGDAPLIPWFGMADVEEAEAWLNTLAACVRSEDLARVPAQFACVRGALQAAAQNAGLNVCSENVTSGGTLQNLVSALEPRTHLHIAALLPAGRAALERARERADLGFRCFKWKVGVADVAEELPLLDDLLSVLPSGSRLRLDANGAWDRRRAERWLERCAERPIEFVEQPVAEDLSGVEDLLFGLAGDFPTPIALDESVVSDADLERWLGLGWPGLYVLKPSLLAEPEVRMAKLAKERAGVVFSSALETRIGAKRLLRLALSWGGEMRPVGAGVWPLFEDGRFDGPFAAPFFRLSDIETLNEEETWNALN